MKKCFLSFFVLSAVILFFNVIQAQNFRKIRYVFLFIGDGMGINQVFTAQRFNELTSAPPLIFLDNKWAFGLSMTECADSNKITDSGAGGTAIACGKRTTYGSIGEYQGKDLESIAEYLHSMKKFKVGVITNVPLNHATPACFYSHESSRKNYDNMTCDLIESGFEFFAGGGFQLGNSDTSKRIYKDFDAIVRKFQENNFNLVFDDDLMNSSSVFTGERVLVIDTALRNRQSQLENVYSDEKNSFPCALDEPQYAMKLADYTGLAQQVLMNRKGFFIMIEGGKIDWACHDNDALTAIYEINAFNAAIIKAYDFYLKHPGQTLIIVTADHETGGMTQGSYLDANSSVKKDGYGLYLKKLGQQEKSYIYTGKESLRKIQDDARIGWATYEHTSAPVGVWAIGKGSRNFSGIMKNEDIKGKILKLIK